MRRGIPAATKAMLMMRSRASSLRLEASILPKIISSKEAIAIGKKRFPGIGIARYAKKLSTSKQRPTSIIIWALRETILIVMAFTLMSEKGIHGKL